MLSESIRELIGKIEATEEAERTAAPGQQALEGNTIVAKAASLYEKLRYLVDYREEHTIRRAALERILKRRVFIEQKAESGLVLLQELVDGKYIPKEAATEEAARDIDTIVNKFLQLSRLASANGAVVRRLISFAATEIDARISPLEYATDHESAEALYKTLRGRVSAYGYSEEETNAQLYCACWRSLLGADDDRLAHALWLLYVPGWRAGSADLQEVAGKLPALVANIRDTVRGSLQWQIAPKIKNESIYFRIIREAFASKRGAAGRILENPTQLDQFTRDFLEKTYEQEKERIQKSGIRAVVYLFVTKMAVALVAELPYEIFVLGGVHYVPLTINILFHPALLFALTRNAGALGEANTNAIVEGIHGVLYEGKARSVRVRSGYSRFTLAFALAYLFLFITVFGSVIGFLELLSFNPVSITLFLFFLALVSYFAFRIRYRARRWKVVREEGTLSIIAGVLAVPIVRAGEWLSRTFSSINVFVMIMDFIIETPFKRLLNFSNQFLLYLREKGEEIR
ncbi:hypothetical protein A3C21_01480 [Candidatus Kaiserbacteria bacterium RIFCSPHIGHO2_02_FULL_59_21]|uniref:Uncharacterized protein n=2 Tax=Candidatus Kaiseribacteriota TaxID=1752734 RepID=A0A0G1YXE3_9BACT|nr:MAG: hypothetical protein UY98_C0004G0002 [Candidatus Kaiserbacteria bacterium GW2011_GWA2_58_9]OGG62473.1 MAG: hypothetical protein A2766_00690 [Candidatus Kaiserbacteria bacterium RIFCSPHIGHO2_01_FULL_58_22]OGG67541.1 MAG: hypothetical protein A3C21_01480 [Candidatus Kaiserbacteria bacterium RIFCSPHIGHO2_02_FULL_59_21]OGG80145.1 MAG: hypothetical protein A2952_03610 [Candidatus Kaiserbacteria bacterium RIFCSPLOWO2_01_FULL_59_34]OGG86936.1 MAG: hypothetical protein A3I47_03000 [Candidatus K